MGNEKSKLLTCTFCGKEFDKSEMVRYRGALSCKTCAYSQEPVEDFNERPFFLIASIGTLIGLFVVTVTVVEAFNFTPMQVDFYTPDMGFYFGGMAIALVLQGFGVYALNRSGILAIAIIGALAAFVSAIAQIVALWDLMTNGPYYVISDVTLRKGFGYYSYTTTTYIIFSFAVGLGILLLMAQAKLDNTSIAAGALYLIGGTLGIFGYLWPPVGFLHILMYVVAFMFFFTRKNIIEKEPIETLDYKTIRE
jgi:hypothetical protein